LAEEMSKVLNDDFYKLYEVQQGALDFILAIFRGDLSTHDHGWQLAENSKFDDREFGHWQSNQIAYQLRYANLLTIVNSYIHNYFRNIIL
jgi:hypothetical protein